ncbi:MAG: hypothetical protein EBR82_15685 [Caulobacteraceae bacterium]|nr:hypothetical protein [Caulobacteraceae bacterium]
MGGYAADPRTRLGLISLLAVRRIKAEKMRRLKAAAARTPDEVEAAKVAEKKTKRSGWFR